MQSLFTTQLLKRHEIISEASRPDGKYFIALAVEEDPDFPELWISDNSTGDVYRLETDHKYEFGIIDWPGDRIFWDKNDFVVKGFDHNHGFTTFEIDLEEKSFKWKGKAEDYYSDILSENWWVDIRHENTVKWLRARCFADGSSHLFSSDHSTPRHYWSLTSKPHITPGYTLLSKISPERKKLLTPPTGESEKEIGVKLEELKPPEHLYFESIFKEKKRSFEGAKMYGLRNYDINFVYLSPTKEEATRSVYVDGEPIFLKVKAAHMYDAGFKFHKYRQPFQGHKICWLTKLVPAIYLERLD